MPHKLYIDSRRRVSGSHSEFDYQLPNPIQLTKQSRCFVDAVHLANIFPTIHQAIATVRMHVLNIAFHRQQLI